jgi:L-alanine-DL-glutamate epimerase-like enolase superfamily enzyme
MRITGVRTTPVNVAFTEPEIWSQGARQGITAIIVEVETDTGIVGIGESVPAPSPEVTIAAVASTSDILVGCDPRRVRTLWSQLQGQGGWSPFDRTGNAALAGVEMALWDVVGKSLGCTVADLFGGVIRDHIEVMGFVQNADPETMEREAATMAAAGYGTLYTKVGFGKEQDVAAATALRTGGGEGVEIRIDPNEAWSPGFALAMAHRLADLRLQYIEQPIRAVGVSEMALLRQRSPVPIAANQSSWTNENVMDLVRANAADVIMTDPWQAGGLMRFAEAAAICEHAGVPLVYHSFAPLSIATRAAMAVLTTTTAVTYAHQTYNHMTAGDIVNDPVEIIDGRIDVSHLPGLGCSIDVDLLAARHDDYRRDGYMNPYGNPNRL